jgi:hypothetical protein
VTQFLPKHELNHTAVDAHLPHLVEFLFVNRCYALELGDVPGYATLIGSRYLTSKMLLVEPGLTKFSCTY